MELYDVFFLIPTGGVAKKKVRAYHPAHAERWARRIFGGSFHVARKAAC